MNGRSKSSSLSQIAIRKAVDIAAIIKVYVNFLLPMAGNKLKTFAALRICITESSLRKTVDTALVTKMYVNCLLSVHRWKHENSTFLTLGRNIFDCRRLIVFYTFTFAEWERREQNLNLFYVDPRRANN